MKHPARLSLFTALLSVSLLGAPLLAGATSVPMTVQAKMQVRCTSGLSSPFTVEYATRGDKNGEPDVVQLTFANDAKTKKQLKGILPEFTETYLNKEGKPVDRKGVSNIVELYLDREDPSVKAKDMLVFLDQDKKLEWTASYAAMYDAPKFSPNMLTSGDNIVAKYCKAAPAKKRTKPAKR